MRCRFSRSCKACWNIQGGTIVGKKEHNKESWTLKSHQTLQSIFLLLSQFMHAVLVIDTSLGWNNAKTQKIKEELYKCLKIATPTLK